MNKILVTGASGQVGSALLKLLGSAAIGIDQKEADLSVPGSIEPILRKLSPSAIINPAAYTQVDRAEQEEALAQKINGDSPGLIARWCAQSGIPFVHYSTDYVFSGNGSKPWCEQDEPSPQNVYGRTKLEGERQVIAASGGKWLILRTSWVYDETGKNFLTTMLRLGREREVISVVNDQFGAPTYAEHLAKATLQALDEARRQSKFPSGIYHLCNSGETTWFGFARAIFDTARRNGVVLKVKSVKGIPTTDYQTPAKRPKNSRMNIERAKLVLGVSCPDWQIGLHECMEQVR